MNIFSAAPLKIVDAFEYTGCMCNGFHTNRDSILSFSSALRTISLALGYNLLSNEAMVSQELEIYSLESLDTVIPRMPLSNSVYLNPISFRFSIISVILANCDIPNAAKIGLIR